MAVIELMNDDVIFQKGDPADCMYEILEGRVEIYNEIGTWEARRLRTLSKGEMFGEMALIDGRPRSALRFLAGRKSRRAPGRGGARPANSA